MSFFRYPGGKKKLCSVIFNEMKDYIHEVEEYKEVFFGAGSVGIHLLNEFKDANHNLKRLYLNDKDYNVYCLWKAVIFNHEELIEKIKSFTPKVENFYEFKEYLTSDWHHKNDEMETAFRKIAIHQISYSGLGTKSGGPLGGKEQKSKYKIDCRWSPDFMIKKILKLYDLFKDYEILVSKQDFSDHINGENAFVYLDPPYFEKGNELYQLSFSESDHVRMAQELKKSNSKWMVSYDDQPEIRELYDWANIIEVNVKYSINTIREKQELIITNV
jgi:DNA adenine methylase